MNIVITGATGFVGQQLVPLLKASGANLLLVGRDAARLAALYPDETTCGYDRLIELGQNFDLLVHLAVVNSNAESSSETFHNVNVQHMLVVKAQADEAGISKFVNISSIHALDEHNHSSYAQSKREAARILQGFGDNTLTLYLPAIHGSRLAGKLALLGHLPVTLRQPLLVAASTLRPTLHVSSLANFLLERSIGDIDAEVVLSDGQQQNMAYQAVKRLIDLSFAASVILLLWWFMAAIWLAVRLQSAGPGIFAQQRVGRNGRVFTCYKFRTMKLGTMKLGTVQAATNEVSSGAVTRMGRFLRKTKIDELPQVWNIIRNEISLVGPRPCLPMQEVLVAARRQRGVLALKPGITGLAQINGVDMSDPDKLARWDERYGALQSLILDMKIILATAFGRGQGDKVTS